MAEWVVVAVVAEQLAVDVVAAAAAAAVVVVEVQGLLESLYNVKTTSVIQGAGGATASRYSRVGWPLHPGVGVRLP